MRKITFFNLIIFMFISQPAFAYLDPGTGSAIMSLIIGFFVAIGVLIKTFWYNKRILGLSKNSKTDIDNNVK